MGHNYHLAQTCCPASSHDFPDSLPLYVFHTLSMSCVQCLMRSFVCQYKQASFFDFFFVLGNHHFLSGHPSAANALLNAKTQPHCRQRSNWVLALSMCSQSRQMAKRRSRSSLLAVLMPLVAKVLALSIRFLAIAEKPGMSPGSRFLKPIR